MKAWVRAAGKLARYEHIGWNEWPHRRCWAFHSGASEMAGSSSGSSRASWPAAVARDGARFGRVRPTSASRYLPDPHADHRSARWGAECSTGESAFRAGRRASAGVGYGQVRGSCGTGPTSRAPGRRSRPTPWGSVPPRPRPHRPAIAGEGATSDLTSPPPPACSGSRRASCGWWSAVADQAPAGPSYGGFGAVQGGSVRP